MAVFDSKDCRIMAAAFDLAWGILSKSRSLAHQDIEIAKGALARGVLHGAESGERDARQLARFASSRFERYRKEISEEREWRQNPHLLQATGLLARGRSAAPPLQAIISSDPKVSKAVIKEPARARAQSRRTEAQTHSPARLKVDPRSLALMK